MLHSVISARLHLSNNKKEYRDEETMAEARLVFVPALLLGASYVETR